LNQLQELIEQPSVWLRRNGPRSDVVLASQVRLSRNLTRHRFPGTSSGTQRIAVLERVADATGDLEIAATGFCLDLDELSVPERRVLVERQLAPVAILSEAPRRRLVVARDESCGFLVNSEDHLQFQAQCSGLDLEATFEICDALDVEMDSRLDFAYSETYGFLTARPARSGTGLRASVVMHLPGLLLRETFDETVAALRRQKILVEGFWLDGVRSDAQLFQISNAATLGKREGEIVRSLDAAVRELLQQEVEARQALLSGAQSLLADRIWRSYGILSQARLLKARETLHHTTRLLLGVQMGILSIPTRVLGELFSLSQDAHSQMLQQAEATRREASDREIDEWRAERVRNELQGVNS
jgi:protein arginine kinase